MNVFEKCLRAEAARDADERVRGHGVTRGRLLSALRKGAAPFREAMTSDIQDRASPSKNKDGAIGEAACMTSTGTS
jgi:hypothetical protein